MASLQIPEHGILVGGKIATYGIDCIRSLVLRSGKHMRAGGQWYRASQETQCPSRKYTDITLLR